MNATQEKDLLKYLDNLHKKGCLPMMIYLKYCDKVKEGTILTEGADGL